MEPALVHGSHQLPGGRRRSPAGFPVFCEATVSGLWHHWHGLFGLLVVNVEAAVVTSWAVEDQQ